MYAYVNGRSRLCVLNICVIVLCAQKFSITKPPGASPRAVWPVLNRTAIRQAGNLAPKMWEISKKVLTNAGCCCKISRSVRFTEHLLPWLSWLEHRVHIAGVVGSSPTGSTTYGALAQLVARLNGIQKVRGSTPLCSTNTTRQSGIFLYSENPALGVGFSGA